MTQKGFDIRPGIYVVPELGRFDTRVTLSDESLIALALSPKFPFITITVAAVKIIKKAKLSQKEIASLILQSKSIEELDAVISIKKSKILDRIVKTKRLSFE